MPDFILPDAVRSIGDTLRRAGFAAYVVGGAVRDLLLGRPPHDWDLATDATPDQIDALFERVLPLGRAFGVMAVVRDGHPYEVATFRTDAPYTDGRRPDAVRFASAREDALRRDFTVNALFYDPVQHEILDFVGGRDDLAARRLRAVGDPDERFREDHLRLLRAVRFAARLDFTLDDATALAVRRGAPLAARVAPERQAAELDAMLTGGHARRAFALLADTGLLAAVLPDVDRMRGVPQPPQFHPEGDVWTHTLLMLSLYDAAATGDFQRTVDGGSRTDAPEDADTGMTFGVWPPSTRAAAAAETWAALDIDARRALAWTVLLHDVGKPSTFSSTDRIRFHDHDRVGRVLAETILTGLRRPRALIDRVADLIGRHMHLAHLRRMREAKRRRWMREPDAPLHLELHRLDCASSHGMLANWEYGMEAWRAERARPADARPLADGRDVMALGIPPGPRVGRALSALADARLEGEVATRAEALDWLRRWRLDEDGQAVYRGENEP